MLFSWLFNKNPQIYRKDYSWPITPLPLWTKPVISKEVLDQIIKEYSEKSNNQVGKV